MFYYLGMVECCSPDTPLETLHRHWGWFCPLLLNSYVSESESLWNSAGNSWTMFPRIPSVHLEAGREFGR